MSAKEIRLHGRGGQGAVLAARMLASALAIEGKYVASFPMYGFERRGMPVVAFTRFDQEPIREKTQIYAPDCVMVIDQTLMGMSMVFEGLKPDGVLIVNSSKPIKDRPVEELGKVGVLNATRVAVEEVGRDVPNTCLMGALAATTGWLGLDSLIKALGEYLDGDILQKNIRNTERGFHEVEVLTWKQ